MKKCKAIILTLIITANLFLCACSQTSDTLSNLNEMPATEEITTELITTISETTVQPTTPEIDLSEIPDFSSKAYYEINNNEPYFTSSEITTISFENYTELDDFGRCGVAFACVGKDIMPTEERGDIGSVKPSGWQTVKYDFVDGKYLYNHCHLIGYQLTGENANTKNLITGTRYLNIKGMLPFENMVADYIKETDNHVMYRVTPIYEEDNLLASGVQMEGYSVEDKGDGICFNVFCYNSQPYVKIDYSNGDSEATSDAPTQPKPTEKTTEKPTEKTVVVESSEEENYISSDSTYILNINTYKFHYPDCSSVKRMKESNKEYYTGSRDNVISRGFVPCKNCNP